MERSVEKTGFDYCSRSIYDAIGSSAGSINQSNQNSSTNCTKQRVQTQGYNIFTQYHPSGPVLQGSRGEPPLLSLHIILQVALAV